MTSPLRSATALLARAVALTLALHVAACGTSGGGEVVADDTAPRGDGGDDATVIDVGSDASIGDVPSGDGPASTDDATSDGGLRVGCSLRATSDLNLRAGPSTADAILHVIPAGDLVTLLVVTPTSGFYDVSHGGADGWASASYLDTSPCTGTTTSDAGGDSAAVASIEAVAGGSSCASYSWKDRGPAPKGYIEGVAIVFARAVCAPTRSDVAIASAAKSTDDVHDALAWYASIFSGLGMSNDVAGVDTLRHEYTLLMGLGLRESSGQYCTGRDTSASNTSSDSAEAGAWQTSWDSHVVNAELPKIFAKYRTSDVGCTLATFSRGVTCSAADWKDWGTGADGLDFQKRSKECPAFAAEYAAVMLRVDGGRLGHYGPLRTQAAEVRPECDAMLKKVQDLVTTTPSLCAGL